MIEEFWEEGGLEMLWCSFLNIGYHLDFAGPQCPGSWSSILELLRLTLNGRLLSKADYHRRLIKSVGDTHKIKADLPWARRNSASKGFWAGQELFPAFPACQPTLQILDLYLHTCLSQFLKFNPPLSFFLSQLPIHLLGSVFLEYPD